MNICTRWAPTSFKRSYNPYKWPCNWVTVVITLLVAVITPLITGRGPPCRDETSLIPYVLRGPPGYPPEGAKFMSFVPCGAIRRVRVLSVIFD